MNKVICPVCGRVHTYKTKGNLCKKHFQQLKKYGEFKDHNPRTKFDPNEIRIKGDIAELDVYDLSGNVIKTFIFDSEDYDLVRRYKWNLAPDGYCRSGSNTIRLHRLVMQVAEGCQVDHINLDITDNRKCNLRVCDNSLNQANRKGYNKWASKGIEQHKNGKWSAYIRRDNKQYHSPVFNTKEEACFARYLLEQIIWPDIQLTQHNEYSLTEEQRKNVLEKITSKYGAHNSSEEVRKQ